MEKGIEINLERGRDRQIDRDGIQRDRGGQREGWRERDGERDRDRFRQRQIDSGQGFYYWGFR